jgi:hypothetical protein
LRAKLQQAKGHLPQLNDGDPAKILVDVKDMDGGIVDIKLCDRRIATGIRHRTLATSEAKTKQTNIKMSGNNFVGHAQLVEKVRLQYQAAINLSIEAAVTRIQLLDLIDDHLAPE